MSEYTTVYLRSKATPLLDYREHPSFEETKNLSKDEIMAAIHEVMNAIRMFASLSVVSCFIFLRHQVGN